MVIDFSNTLAFVTGGGSGIGRATATALRRCGATVTIADRKIDAAEAVAAEIGAEAVELDIAQEQNVEEVVARTEKRHGPIGVLVNCAGNLQNTDPPATLTMEMWDRITNVHQRGTYLVTRAVGLRMVERRRGSIVTIASSAGMRSTPLHAYAPAKAALISQTENLAVEWGRCGVRVNAVSPGFVPTPGVSRGFKEKLLDPEILKQHSALGRLVEPSEIANAVLFLASDLASAITGVNLVVDAGWIVGTNWAAYGGIRQSSGTVSQSG